MLVLGRSLIEIRHYQRTVGTLLRKTPFIRLVREIMNTVADDLPSAAPIREFRWSASALHDLQVVCEEYICSVMQGKF